MMQPMALASATRWIEDVCSSATLPGMTAAGLLLMGRGGLAGACCGSTCDDQREGGKPAARSKPTALSKICSRGVNQNNEIFCFIF